MIKLLRYKLGRPLTLLITLCFIAGSTTAPGQIASPVGDEDQLILLNFRDAPLDQVLDFYADITGKTMIKSPGLNATITIKGQTRLSPTEALLAIEAVLAMHNVALAPLGDKFLKVVQPTALRQEGFPISQGLPEEPFPQTDQLLSQIIDLKYIDVSEAQPIVQSMVHGYGKIQPLDRTNSMLITDTSANLQRIMEILAYIDRPVEAKEDVFVREIRYAEASTIASKLNELIAEAQAEESEDEPRVIPPSQQVQSPAGIIRARREAAAQRAAGVAEAAGGSNAEELAERGIIRGKVKIVADDRTSILFIISRPENFAFFDKIIDVLDRPIEAEFIVRVVALEYADSEEVAGILNEFIGAASAEDGAGPGGEEGEGEGGDGGESTSLRDFVRQRAQERVREVVETTGAATKIGRLSPETKILADSRTNSLLLMGRRGDITAIEDLLSELDTMLAQVLIEAVILEVNLTDNLEYGVDWLQRSYAVFNEEKAGPGKGITVREPVYAFGGGFTGSEGVQFQDGAGIFRDAPLNPGGLTYFTTLYDLNIDAIIKLAADSSDTRIVSTPVILTTDNKEAKIVIGEERPIVTSSSTTDTGTQTSNFEYRNIGIELTVTPRINPQEFVVMDIVQTADNVGGFEVIDGNRVPIITKREMQASIAVASRSTIVLGGLVGADMTYTRVKVPILGDIPILGALFRSDRDEDSRSEIIVLITPYVMSTPEAAHAETKRVFEGTNARKVPWEKGWSDSEFAQVPPRKRSLRKNKIATEVADMESADEAPGRSSPNKRWYVIKNEMVAPEDEEQPAESTEVQEEAMADEEKNVDEVEARQPEPAPTTEPEPVQEEAVIDEQVGDVLDEVEMIDEAGEEDSAVPVIDLEEESTPEPEDETPPAPAFPTMPSFPSMP